MRSFIIFASCAVAVVIAGPALGANTVSSVILRVTATDGVNSDTVDILSSALVPDPVAGDPNRMKWQGSVDLGDPFDPFARVTDAVLTLSWDATLGPFVVHKIGFAAAYTASTLDDTTFHIELAEIGFNPVSAPYTGGRLTASVGATDGDGDPDGFASIQEAVSGEKIVSSYFNGPPVLFHRAVSGAAGDPASAFENYPSPGPFEALGYSVDRMSADLDFVLSRTDNGSSNTTFFLQIPEPAAIGLLLAGGLLVLRARR